MIRLSFSILPQLFTKIRVHDGISHEISILDYSIKQAIAVCSKFDDFFFQCQSLFMAPRVGLCFAQHQPVSQQRTCVCVCDVKYAQIVDTC